MPLIIPPIMLEEPPESEKAVYEALCNSMGDDWIIFHSLNMFVRDQQQKLVDGEIDFLLLSPKLGILVIEVKGGNVKFDGSTRQWSQNGHALKKCPYSQARKAKYAVKTFLEKYLKAPRDIHISCAVCFPNVFEEIKVLPMEGDHEITINGDGVRYIDKAVKAVMLSQLRQKHSKGDTGMDTNTYEHARNALLPVFEYGVSLIDRMSSDERHFFKLTNEQLRLLNIFDRQKQLLIQGCAGSGKTLMAIKKAQQLASQNKKALLLCYNIPLAEHLKQELKQWDKFITVSTYHAFCMGVLKSAGIDPGSDKQPGFWDKVVPELFSGHIKDNAVKFDAVIVDEGQDFKTEYWVTVSDLVKEDGDFYIFYDPDQNLFGGDLQFPIEGEAIVLQYNCRNTRRICEAVLPHTQNDLIPFDGSPEGAEVVEVRPADDSAKRRELSRLLHQLIREEGLKPGNIIILGGHRFGSTFFKNDPVLGAFKVVREFKGNKAANDIGYETHMRFKGLERDVVILFDVDLDDDRWQRRALYTAKSRARHVLYVVYK